MAEAGRGYSGKLIAGQLRRELDRLLQELLAASESFAGSSTWAPPVDVVERPGELLVVVEVPGLRAADLAVEAERGAIRVTGSRQLSFPSSDEVQFHCLERQEGSFSRRVEIPHAVDLASANATLRRGLLVITLPRIEDRRRGARAIPIVDEMEGDNGNDGA